MSRIGIITGLAEEADCLDVFAANERPLIGVAAAQPEKAEILAAEMISGGCQALLSFGMAGGLAAEVASGDVIVASSVVAPEGQTYETSTPWCQGVLERLGDNASIGVVAGSGTVVDSPAAKTDLASATGAVIVDMESQAVAVAAADAGIPFLVIRAVADPVDGAIPAWLTGNISETGTPKYLPIMAGLAMHPWDLPGLLRLKGDSGRAITSLRRVAGRLGPLFGFG